MLNLATLLLFTAVIVDLLWRQAPLQSLLALYGGLSLLALIAYGWDKLAAIRQLRRTPERDLLLLGLLGGWPGAWLAQTLFRHKSAKRSYRLRFWLSVLINLSALLAGLYHAGIPTITTLAP